MHFRNGSHFCCALAVIIAMLFTACSKEGPKGDQGANGSPGPAGPAGPAGPGGTTSNVIYSDWLDLKFKPDTVIQGGGKIDTLGYYSDINATKITNDLLSNGEIKVYINTANATNPVIIPLPYFSPASNLYINPTFFAGGIELYSNGDMSTTTSNNQKIYQYRYVIVPGSVATTSQNKSINWNNYSEVKSLLNLAN